MDLWGQDDLDLLGPASIEFLPDARGSIRFLVVEGWMDCRSLRHGERAGVEFTWEGNDEGDATGGRGSALIQEDGSLAGHIYFHLGDDSGFLAVRHDDSTR